MKINLFKLSLFFLAISCSDDRSINKHNEVNIDLLKSTNDVFEAGLKLMAMPNGLHELELNDNNQDTLVVSVHGNNSRGYEWVYPLEVIDTDTNLITFFRWDDNSCVNPSVSLLNEFIQDKLKNNKNIQNVVLFGHSYGGLLVVSFMEQWTGELPLEVHTIAAPLRGLGSLSLNCNYKTPTQIPKKSSLFEWRTIQKLDGAFKNLNYDPQNVEIVGSKVTRLPGTYKNNKLGHNWSISWVADNLMKDIQG
ncbi:MAG: alpha/beta hydrolase [Gammaproteobacteria bacterium]|jgi:hypothetical protein|tara:strand:- start:147 stop:896 length:750 start_codon:yes stop_codon:yes gene_type:complete